MIPTFDWRDSMRADNTRRERRVALRVYLDRPWYVSGDGEKLGVRMAMRPVSVPGSGGDGGDHHPPSPQPFDEPNIVPVPP